MIVQKELVAIYDYEVPVPEDPFSFRLEIHKCSELFTGSVYRLERFRLRPTFHQRDREDVDPQINDALIYIRDECNDERKLRGESPEPVIVI
ncbi:TPA: protein YehK, partial [Escherichia coli]